MRDAKSEDPPPTFPQLLAGDPEQLRLSPASIAWLIGCGAAIEITIHFLTPHTQGWLAESPWPVAAVAIVVLTAAVAARWLGRFVGTVAGLLQLTSLYALGFFPKSLSFDPLIAGLSTVAMVAFAAANVPGRLPSDVHRRTMSLLFYGGAAPLLLLGCWSEFESILLACLSYLLLNQDGRAFRFLIRPLGLGVLAIFLGLTIWLHRSAPQVAEMFEQCSRSPTATGWRPLAVAAVGMLPWTPLCAVAVLVGCRRGHYATAFWQFVACWSLAPLVLAALGVMGDRTALAIISPPLAILAAAGLNETVVWSRKRRLRACS